jgi:DnaK suppressor protein
MLQAVTDKQRAALRRKLEARYSVLREEIRAGLLASDNENYRQLAGEVADYEDESLADLLVDVRLAEIDRDLEELRDIEAAQARMREGSYDVCVACGAAIPYKRLDAYPTAKRCEPCQRKHEHETRATRITTL